MKTRKTILKIITICIIVLSIFSSVLALFNPIATTLMGILQALLATMVYFLGEIVQKGEDRQNQTVEYMEYVASLAGKINDDHIHGNLYREQIKGLIKLYPYSLVEAKSDNDSLQFYFIDRKSGTRL